MVLLGGGQKTFETKCTKSKMSESDLFKRNGIAVHDLSNKYHKNFNQYEVLQQKLATSTSSSSKAGPENSDQSSTNKFHNSSSGARIAGGRLQFFKDGKFILELASSREGERLGWVSVPRKTYWPPTISSNSSVSFQKHESSTSLSYSDDNSSIQSSPWQRDHCWKQSLPRRNISKEMCLYFHRPSNLQPVEECLILSKKKCRRPQDKNFQIHQVQKVTGNAALNTSKRTVNVSSEESKNTQNDNHENTDPTKEETARDPDSPKSDGKIEEKPALNGKKSKLVVRETLASVVKKLSERNPTIVSAQNARMSQLSISNHHHVSPRKRFLRELEKVSLEDKAMKRSRAKTSTTISGTMASMHSSSANIKSPGGRHMNGNSTVAAETISLSPSVPHTNNSRPISSYSITSLLGHNNDSSSNKNGRKEESSPLTASHQHKEFEHSRSLKSSPEQISQKMFSSVVAMSSGSGRKRASPIYHPHSPSPISSEQSKQSPNLSSSPEQQHQHQQQHNLNKYRQHPYIYNPLQSMMGSPSVSSPNYTVNPRYSPSPNAENYSQKFRSNFLTSSSPSASYNSSPSHQLIKRESPVSTSSPTALSGGRKSPLFSAKYMESPTHQTNFNSHFGHYQAMVAKDRDRDLSPSRSPKKYEKQTASTSTSTSSSGSGRTVPKKNASLRQQYDSPTDILADHSNEGNYKQHLNKLKNYSKEGVGNNKGQPFKMSEYENEGRNESADNYVNSSTGMSIDALHNPIIRPSLIPSLSSAAATHSSHPSLYYMYNHPLHHPQSSLQAHIQAQQNPFLPPTAVPSYYHLYAAAAASAAVFRPLWPHYPGMAPTTTQHHHSMPSPSANSRISGSLMNFSGSNGLLVHPNLAEPPGSWEQAARHSMSPNEMMRVKEESNSDVPLNLSKH